MGISFIENLGDINDDGNDEVGFIINNVDNSNFNYYNVLTIKQNKFVKILDFVINERLNFETEALFEGKYIIRKIDNQTIKYKFYSDSATVETGTYRWK